MRNIKVLISTVETPEFRPNQHLSNKGIKQKINSRRIVLISYWSTQHSELWRGFSNGRLVVPPGLKLPVSIAKLEWQLLASFPQEKPWRQNRTLSPFFVIVSLSMRYYVQADLLSYANFIKVVLDSSSCQCCHTWKEK